MSDIDIIACARRASTGCTCDPCKDLNVLADYVAAVAPLVERLRVLGEAVSSDYHPTCETVHYGSGCPGSREEDVAFWRAAFALLAADAAARGGK